MTQHNSGCRCEWESARDLVKNSSSDFDWAPGSTLLMSCRPLEFCRPREYIWTNKEQEGTGCHRLTPNIRHTPSKQESVFHAPQSLQEHLILVFHSLSFNFPQFLYACITRSFFIWSHQSCSVPKHTLVAL